MSIRKRVLFVCIGNSCRSQMAEAFARHYGSDLLIPASAGLHPAFLVAPDTIRAMREKNIDIRDHFPKGLKNLGRAEFDLVINISGRELPDSVKAPIQMWLIRDPINEEYSVHCEIRDEIERYVLNLIDELRHR